jgi:hypothetical protein
MILETLWQSLEIRTWLAESRGLSESPECAGRSPLIGPACVLVSIKKKSSTNTCRVILILALLGECCNP